jgi:hypothetical protein
MCHSHPDILARPQKSSTGLRLSHVAIIYGGRLTVTDNQKDLERLNPKKLSAKMGLKFANLYWGFKKHEEHGPLGCVHPISPKLARSYH